MNVTRVYYTHEQYRQRINTGIKYLEFGSRRVKNRKEMSHIGDSSLSKALATGTKPLA